MLWFWIPLALLAGAAGVRHLRRVRPSRSAGAPPSVDDAALRQILEQGTLGTDDDEPLDLEAAARAEEEFWDESWDEPEEYPR